METEKVKIRIAVVVDSDGNYNSAGWSDVSENMDECFDVCFEGLVGKNTIEHQHVVEVEVDIPKLSIIEGTATKQPES